MELGVLKGAEDLCSSMGIVVLFVSNAVNRFFNNNFKANRMYSIKQQFLLYYIR